MLAAIARQLRVLTHSAASAAPAAIALRRLLLVRFRWRRRDVGVFELVFVDQPHPLRFRLRFRFGLRTLFLLTVAMGEAHALRRPRLAKADQHLFAQSP